MTTMPNQHHYQVSYETYLANRNFMLEHLYQSLPFVDRTTPVQLMLYVPRHKNWTLLRRLAAGYWFTRKLRRNFRYYTVTVLLEPSIDYTQSFRP